MAINLFSYNKSVESDGHVDDSIRVYDDVFKAKSIAKEVMEGIESLERADHVRDTLTNLLINSKNHCNFNSACEDIHNTVSYCSGVMSISKEEIIGSNVGLESINSPEIFFNSALEGIGNFISKLIEKIKDFFKWLWGKIKSFFKFITGKGSKEDIEKKVDLLANVDKKDLEENKKVFERLMEESKFRHSIGCIFESILIQHRIESMGLIKPLSDLFLRTAGIIRDSCSLLEEQHSKASNVVNSVRDISKEIDKNTSNQYDDVETKNWIEKKISRDGTSTVEHLIKLFKGANRVYFGELRKVYDKFKSYKLHFSDMGIVDDSEYKRSDSVLVGVVSDSLICVSFKKYDDSDDVYADIDNYSVSRFLLKEISVNKVQVFEHRLAEAIKHLETSDYKRFLEGGDKFKKTYDELMKLENNSDVVMKAMVTANSVLRGITYYNDSKEEIFSYSRALSDMSKGLIEAAKNTSMSIFSLTCDSIDNVLRTIVNSDPSTQSIGKKL